MKSPIAALLLISIGPFLCSAGVVQERFLELTTEASKVTIERASSKKNKHRLSYSTSDQETIERFKEKIELLDPVPEFTADGHEIISSPCFCVAEYVFTFEGEGMDTVVYYLHHHNEVTIGEDYGLGYATDVALTKRSKRKLRSFLRTRNYKKVNQTSLTTSAAARPTS
ncbi:hypothetical protein [Pelagicoccus sp. SDUM812002]|uniref:hypothetical protein n=1 Tax=Pelagicoccus sp. SDUM812002 TaxID=3041266 RepID=UPI00280F49FF|nr:hypothetical protein [Pelagicoccus sp. SDUM812002]MDQ8188585.1 hypothetical protein [Pelagicoccus sp. SDUM812002]